MLASKSPVHLAFPKPISVNNLYNNRSGRGRVKTAEYRAWIKAADDLLRLQGELPFFLDRVDILIFAGEAEVGNMDADNCNKAIVDALKRHGVIRDDSKKWVRSVTAEWVKDLAGAVVRVSVAAAPTPASHVASLVNSRLLEGVRT